MLIHETGTKWVSLSFVQTVSEHKHCRFSAWVVLKEWVGQETNRGLLVNCRMCNFNGIASSLQTDIFIKCCETLHVIIFMSLYKENKYKGDQEKKISLFCFETIVPTFAQPDGVESTSCLQMITNNIILSLFTLFTDSTFTDESFYLYLNKQLSKAQHFLICFM